MHIWERIDHSRSSNVLIMRPLVRAVCGNSCKTNWKYGSSTLLAQKKLGRSRRRRNLSIVGKLVTSQSRSSSFKGNSPVSMSWSKEKYAQKEQALAVWKRIMGTLTSSTTSIAKVKIPSAMMQVTGWQVLELWHH